VPSASTTGRAVLADDGPGEPVAVVGLATNTSHACDDFGRTEPVQRRLLSSVRVRHVVSDAPRGLLVVLQRCALGGLVSHLYEKSSEMHQTEQSEQVHNVVENEHFSLLSPLDMRRVRMNISERDTPLGYTWYRPCGRQRSRSTSIEITSKRDFRLQKRSRPTPAVSGERRATR
jgi:hypothetical protein